VAVSFLRIQHSAAPFESLDLQLNGGVFATRDTKTNVILKSATAMPTDRWVCLEWHVQLATTGMTSLLVDGTLASGLSQQQDTTGTVPYDWLLIGLESAPASLNGGPDVKLWLDELVVSGSPIGCTS
jgi:hypothetical protein